MGATNKIEYLIVDTSAFIKNAPLQEFGVNILTEQDVVNEITNKRQLRRLVVLPYDLNIKNVDAENIKFVTDFAKKTGDYTSLSATDIKVIALTYQLEKEKVGIAHLKEAPTMAQTMDASIRQTEDLSKPLIGFYMPQEEASINDDSKVEDVINEDMRTSNALLCCKKGVTEIDNVKSGLVPNSGKSLSDCGSEYEVTDSSIDCKSMHNLSAKFSNLNYEPTEFIVRDKDESTYNVDDILPSVTDLVFKNENNSADSANYDVTSEDDDNYDEDYNGWITPSNFSKVKKEIDPVYLEEKPVLVACLTMDFAMQNVLKQIGLNVVTLDGKVIKQMRTFIFRCYACFKTTSIMTKVFCPHCGHKTLKKVSVSVDEDGKQKIHINFRKPISTKGKRFSLPLPRGGKHADNPVLCEDQPRPDQRSTRLARIKNDPLQDDYVAGYSPFVMRDVYSKSATLGIRPGNTVKYWMKRNPNECRRKRK
ncbi:hypothetical protein KM043_015655 [Ampulex compressa]|nr:hypothetical protein KM043_015655 [Ampulex compressa]